MVGLATKVVDLRALEGAPSNPSVETVTALTPVAWHPTANVMGAQDTLCASAARVLATVGLAGSDEYPFDQSEDVDGAAAQAYPTADEWRTIWGPLPRHVTPGCYLEAHVIYVPSGNTHREGEQDWEGDGARGDIRVRATWTNGAETDGPNNHAVALEPSLLGDDAVAGADAGQLPTDAGGEWTVLRETLIEEIWPPGVDSSASTAADFAEWTQVELEIQLRGGARIVDVFVYERPLRHAQEHDDVSPQSCHAFHVGAGEPVAQVTQVPQSEVVDGLVWEDQRFGSHQTLRVGSRQGERLSDPGLAWTAWTSEDDTFDELDIPPLTLSGATTPTGIFTGTAGYDEDAAAWLVSGAYSQRHDACEPLQVMRNGGRAVVEVRVWVDAEWTSGGGASGWIRLQSSPTEWVDVEFTDSGTRETLEVIGWLETQVAADQDHATLQVLYWTDDASDEIELYGWGFRPGHWA